MIFLRRTLLITVQVTLLTCGIAMLTACNSIEKSSALCETHFNAKSYKIALKHCIKAAEEGDAAAQYYLGLIYVKQDKASDGHVLIKTSAEAGFKKAVFHQTVETLLEEDDAELAQQALRRMQTYAESGDDVAQFWMGNVFLFGYAQQKRSPNEASHWYQLATEQNNLRAMNNLAWIKANARDSELFDPEGALRLALKVVETYPESHGYLDTLAAAFAANGQFDDAVRVQNEALKIARTKQCKQCSGDIVEYYQSHLDFYLKKKPLEEDLFK